MRKPGRVLFSGRAIRAIIAPSTLPAQKRAWIRHAIRKAVTSAIDDMIYIHEKADGTTRRHVEKEARRLTEAIGCAAVNVDRSRTAGSRDNASDAGPVGEEQADVQSSASQAESDFENSLW